MSASLSSISTLQGHYICHDAGNRDLTLNKIPYHLNAPANTGTNLLIRTV